MAKKKKTFSVWGEFKAFISRGNIVDMAVGVIIASAFTAIVSALTDKILKPFINWIIYLCAGGNAEALNKMYTILVPVYVLDDAGNIVNDATTGQPALDMAKCIYIDWGAFISAIINFLLVAIILFTIVKVINTVRIKNEELKAKAKADAEERYYAAHPEERPVPAEPGAPKPTAEELLSGILAELKKQNGEEK